MIVKLGYKASAEQFGPRDRVRETRFPPRAPSLCTRDFARRGSGGQGPPAPMTSGDWRLTHR